MRSRYNELMRQILEYIDEAVYPSRIIKVKHTDRQSVCPDFLYP